MALVLRKAVLPKNVSLLKCIKGRSLANAANKKNPAPLSSAAACRSMKDEAKLRPVRFARIGSMQQLPSAGRHRELYRTVALRYCMSCPDLVPAARTQCRPPLRHRSPPPARASPSSIFSRPTIPFCSLNPQYSFLQPSTIQTNTTRSYAKPACPCPCPFPCGPCGCPCGCGCLPPPCNQPPKCIQYMTGYYYYPYGFWFCGPYHVQGTCAPVGPCGPCPPPCPPPKCPCPACICPAAATLVADPAAMPKAEPPRPQSPQPPRGMGGGPPPLNHQIKCSLPNESPQARTGLSKFFPFNSSMTPGLNAPKDPKKPSAFSAFICPYSTQVRIHPRSKSIPSERQPSHPSNFSAYSQTSFNLSKNPKPTSSPFPSSNGNCFGNPISKVPVQAFNKSITDFSASQNYLLATNRSQSQLVNSCPPLEKPRSLLSPVQRDRPRVKPGVFDYTSIPNFKSPYPLPTNESNFKPYEYNTEFN